MRHWGPTRDKIIVLEGAYFNPSCRYPLVIHSLAAYITRPLRPADFAAFARLAIACADIAEAIEEVN